MNISRIATVASLCLIQVLLATTPPVANASSAASTPFPRPPELEPDIRFWRRIYTEVGTDGGFIHDPRNLSIVYEVVRFDSAGGREAVTERSKRKIRDVLLALARGKRSQLTQEEHRILDLFPKGVSDATLRAAANEIRFQLGQADRFRAGLIRSGAWRNQILAILRNMGLPEELVALPHVESSYTPHAYSHAGAAGLFQFTRSTGQRYMRVDNVVDERLDPLVAAAAAARLLEHNLQTTGTWPLALTAYNHGAAGMRRAAREVGSTDIAVIVRKYKSPSFGFASRNFYVEFLAALEVDRNAERYFGVLQRHTPTDYDTATMSSWIFARPLANALNVDVTTLRDHNPALRDPVWNGSKRIPKDYALHIPRSYLKKPLSTLLAAIPSEQRYASQTRDSLHKVVSGESLSGIAARYGVRIDDLVAINGLRNRHSIRTGQTLRLPGAADKHPGTEMASVTPAPRTPATAPSAQGGAPSALVAARPAPVTTPSATVARASATVIPAPAPVTPVSAPAVPRADGLYAVQRGDTISSIAMRFGVSERELMKSNRVANRNRIHVGQLLRVGPRTPAALAEASPPAAPLATTPAVPETLPVDPGLAHTSPEVADGTLQADPNDYSVAADNTIEIQIGETFGHYAEWLDMRSSRLRALNPKRTSLVVGNRLRLDFSSVSHETFEARRNGYHRALQQAFFEQNEIVGAKVHIVRGGDSIWTLAQQQYDVPLWLVRQYNPDVDFAGLKPGAQLAFPAVRARTTN